MDNESKSMLNAIIKDAIRVVTDPAGFYQDMPKSGGYADPVIFVLVMAAIMGLMIAVFSLLGAGVVGAMSAGLAAVIIIPIFALIGSFIAAAIMFVIWKLMGSGENYETAYRCVAYASAIYPITGVLGLVPYVSSIVGVVWGVYLIITASIKVHALNQKTTYIVLGILGALMLVMNVGSEKAAREMQTRMEEMGVEFGDAGKHLDQSGEMTSEEAGKALGEFMKGFSEAAQGMGGALENGGSAEGQEGTASTSDRVR